MYNTGQSAVTVKDLFGREYPAIAEVNRKRRVNGQREITLSFLYTEINRDFIQQLEFGWKVLFGGEWYTITHPGYTTDGDYFMVEVTAILSFFVELNGYFHQDKAEDKSMTAINYFSEVFAGTPYNYVLLNSPKANTLSYQDNESKTERFLYGIERFLSEFTVKGNLAYISDLIGSDKDVILHEDLNVKSVKIDIDASGFHTWAKGYGDLPEATGDEEPEYQLKVEYRSPLISKYGAIEGPALKDGNYKQAAALTEAVKNQVENSYLVSTEIDALDLSNNGYPEMVLEEGDRVWLFVSKLNLNQQVRVVEIDETFDWQGNLIDVKYTVGNEGIAARYQAQQHNTLKDFKDLINGKKKFAYDWFPDSIKRAADIINGNLESNFKYGAGEIIGINKNNPNGYMRFNTDGIGFSRDGGKTYKSAMTYEGVVAESIVGQSIIGVNLGSLTNEGYFRVNGYNAEFFNNLSGRRATISPDGLYGYNSNGSTQFQADRLLVTSAALGTSNSNVYLAPDANNEVRVVDVNSIPSDGVAENYSYRPIRAQGLRFGPGANGYIGTEGEVRITSSGFVREDGSIIYRPLRAGAIHSSNFISTTTSLWMGTDSAMHVVNKGFVEGSSGSPIYRDVYASNFFGTAFVTRTTNAYIGVDGEVRMVNKGFIGDSSVDTPIWRDVRAGNLFTTGLVAAQSGNLYAGTDDELRVTARSGYNGGSPIYRNVRANGYYGQFAVANPSTYYYIGTDLGLRVTSRGLVSGGSGPIYRDVFAASFVNGSKEEYKENIEYWEGGALETILSSDLYTYHLKSERGSVNIKQKYGLIIGEGYNTPNEVINGDGVEQYTMNSYSWKAIQEMYEKFTNEIALLKQEITNLKQSEAPDEPTE